MSELEKLGGWPILEGDKWKEKNFTLNMASEFMKNGHNWRYLISLGVGLDLKNTTQRVIAVGRGRGRLPDDVFLIVSISSNPEQCNTLNIDQGKTSQAITPFHYFDYLKFELLVLDKLSLDKLYHIIPFITR